MKTQSYKILYNRDERLMLIEFIVKAETVTFTWLKNYHIELDNFFKKTEGHTLNRSLSKDKMDIILLWNGLFEENWYENGYLKTMQEIK